MALGGVVVALGGLAIASGVGSSRSAPASASSSSFTTPAATRSTLEKPTPFDKTTAVALVVTRLVLRVVDGNAAPVKLLAVDDTASKLEVDEAHAELSNLRVRISSQNGWLTVNACYAYVGEWRLSSLGREPACER